MVEDKEPLGSDEQVMEAVRESNDAPQGLETDEKAAKAVKHSNDLTFELEKQEDEDAAP